MTTDISPERIAELLKDTTPGPWRAETWHVGSPSGIVVHGSAHITNDNESTANARFIAAARELVPALAARIAKLEAALEWYANEENYAKAHVIHSENWREFYEPIPHHGGKVARAALKGKPE